MPFYDYVCNNCNNKVELRCLYEERLVNKSCDCGGNLLYQFPMSAAQGYVPFEPYYDESLNIDIHGLRHKQQVMKALGVIEAGDKVHGARNYDDKSPNNIKPIAKLSGRSLDDYRREEDIRQQERANFVVSDEKGDYKKADDLPS